MPPEGPYRVLKPGRVLVDHGPMTLTIQASAGGQPHPLAALAGAERALALLDELVPHLGLARRAVSEISELPAGAPEVLRRMVAAVRVLDEGDFTPMAAVAGAFAELIAEAVLAAGADRAVVNNGGDIAARAAPGERIRVGIVSDLVSRLCTHYLDLAEGMAGVATSGFGGRSLTKGIASAAVAVAVSASVADALATALGNATNVAHPAIERCLAEELDPGTDIRGQVVTQRIGCLPRDARRAALQNGDRRARQLHQRGVLLAWAIFQGDMVVTCPKDLVKALPGQAEV
ncbi:MAG: UPF0280 family protein [Chloroflexota bacterium]|nr:UPF0280 family protein [Chloroflexota bacterium]